MKENRIKYLTISVFVLALINIALIIFLLLPKPDLRVRQDNRDRYAERNKGARFLSEKLELNEDQKKEFKNMFLEHRQRKDSLNIAIMSYKKQLAEYVTKGEQNEKKLDEIMRLLTEAHMANERELFNHFQQLRQICTPEQLERLQEMINSRRERMAP